MHLHAVDLGAEATHIAEELQRSDPGRDCYVRDNGAGFDPAYSYQLFQPFQRLHNTREFPGSGVGLASVRQIMERHGGCAGAEGAIGKGAAFHFTIKAEEIT